ncbi:hypothetical protein HKK80_11115 [Halonotius sp. F2-221B]|uniref:hypothetical protein n=1 Tax=Halonotius sp. F2-221B TaxID=2731620 RepID=UPI00398AFE90
MDESISDKLNLNEYEHTLIMSKTINRENLDISDEKKVDVLISHYEQMRTENRQFANESHRRNMRVIIAIGVILGSIFVSQSAVALLAVIPVLITYIYIRHAQAARWLININSHITRIQNQLSIETFDWEQTEGYGSGDSIHSIISIYDVAFVILIYLISCLIGVAAIEQAELNPILGFGIGQNIILIFYFLLSLTWIAAGKSVIQTWRSSELSG